MLSRRGLLAGFLATPLIRYVPLTALSPFVTGELPKIGYWPGFDSLRMDRHLASAKRALARTAAAKGISFDLSKAMLGGINEDESYSWLRVTAFGSNGKDYHTVSRINV